MQAFDLVVVGTGVAGASVATKCRKAGWSVAICDKRTFGGTCALRGCNPKKVLVRAAELHDWARRSDGRLVEIDGLGISWPRLTEFQREFTRPVAENTEAKLRAKGLRTLRGSARFLGSNELDVGGERLEARHIVIAAGARPAPLGIPGEELVTTSDEFLELSDLPARLLFIGGGFVSFEFAHAAARRGSEVTILERGEQPLAAFDAGLVERLVERSRELGIAVEIGTTATAVRRVEGALRVQVEADDRTREVEADLVVHGAGRVPDLDDLGLKAGNVAYDERGVLVGEDLRSPSNPSVYAAGDCAATDLAPLTPTADYHARRLSATLLGEEAPPRPAAVPRAVFTVPALARVGMREEEARASCASVRVSEGDLGEWGSMKKVSEPCAGYKVVLDEENDRILGVCAPRRAVGVSHVLVGCHEHDRHLIRGAG
jgi:glutathione reductase (NADPH)